MTKKSFKENFKQFNTLNTKLAAKFKSSSADKNIDLFKKFGGITEYIGTGNHKLNAILSGSLFGGIPNTRSIELAGLSGTGKSFLAMNIVREAQAMGYFIYYIDTEGAIDDIDMIRMGINMEQMHLIKTIKVFHVLRQFITQIIEHKKDFPDLKIMLVVDSFVMLNTQKELDDAKKGHNASDMGTRAKFGRQLFRNITLDLSNLQIPFIFTNHTSATLDLFAYDKEIPAGGGGPTFAASIILLLEKAPYKETNADGKKVQTGVFLKARTYKNRLATPQTIQFHLSFAHGMNKYYGLVDDISWENCMVERGNIYTEEEFMKKWKDGIARNTTKKELITHWIEKKVNKELKKFAFVANKNSKFFGHGERMENIGLDTWLDDRMFTPKTLKMLDENVIMPTFKYSSIEDAVASTQNMLTHINDDKIEDELFTLEDKKDEN